MRKKVGSGRGSGLIGAVALVCSCSSTAQPVAPSSRGLAAWNAFEGCAAPSPESGRHIFLDPVKGENRNDGTSRHPWPALQLALSAHEADIRPGDTLELMSGDHGEVALNRMNDGFVRLENALGAIPVLRRVSIGGSKWALSGLTFRNDRRGPLVDLHGARDIIVEKSRFLSAEDARDWTPTELAEKGATGINIDGRSGERCLTIRDNTMLYLNYSAKILADKTVFAGNTIDRFGGDGVNYHGSYLIIGYNTITNAREVNTGEHIDAIQGIAPGGQGWDPRPNAHVTIEGNIVIRQTDPALAYPAGMQGIDAFDGDWTDLRVVNNLVITNAFHGIFYASVHHGLIANNTVVSDEDVTINHPPNVPQPVKLTGERVWIGVGDRTHEGSPSNDVVVRNNIAQSMQITALPGAVEADHNIVYHMWYQGQRGEPHPLSITAAGDLGDHNRLAPSITRGFVAYDPKTFRFDLHLTRSSPARGAGDSRQAPTVDIEGVTHAAAIDVGAYAYREGSR